MFIFHNMTKNNEVITVYKYLVGTKFHQVYSSILITKFNINYTMSIIKIFINRVEENLQPSIYVLFLLKGRRTQTLDFV